jgi:hypothetical protein
MDGRCGQGPIFEFIGGCALSNSTHRCFELIKLQRKDISLDGTILDGVLKSYLAGETLTLHERASYFEIFLSNRKGWQKKVDKGKWEADLRCMSLASNFRSCD